MLYFVLCFCICNCIWIQPAWYLISMVNALPTAPTVTIYFHFKSKSFARIHQSCTCFCSNCKKLVVLYILASSRLMCNVKLRPKKPHWAVVDSHCGVIVNLLIWYLSSYLSLLQNVFVLVAKGNCLCCKMYSVDEEMGRGTQETQLMHNQSISTIVVVFWMWNHNCLSTNHLSLLMLGCNSPKMIASSFKWCQQESSFVNTDS